MAEADKEGCEECERLSRENDFLRALVGTSDRACVYCGLGATEQSKCASGFPGCARADDQMLCREAGVGMERDRYREALMQLCRAGPCPIAAAALGDSAVEEDQRQEQRQMLEFFDWLKGDMTELRAVDEARPRLIDSWVRFKASRSQG